MFPNFRSTNEENRGADNHSADHLQRAGGVEEEDGLEDEGGDDVGRVVHQTHHVRLLHLEGEDAEHLHKGLGDPLWGRGCRILIFLRSVKLLL